jgi:hypothetical protein
MQEKLGTLFTFFLFGFGLALLIPIYRRKYLFADLARKSAMISVEPRWIATCAGLLSVLMLVKLRHAPPWSYLACSMLFGIAAGFTNHQFHRKTAIAVFLGLLIATVLPWWLRDGGWTLPLSMSQVAIFFLVVALSYWMLTRISTSEQEESALHRTLLLLIYLVFSLGVAFFVLSVSAGLIMGNLIAWHHWGAYIGPAQMIAAGAVPLYDIPLQYGLGPSLILAQSCKYDCWSGMYWLSSFATILLTYLLGAIALQFNRSRHPLSVAITLGFVAVSCLLWTTYPPQLIGAIATPSTGGMRFLPGVLMLFWALRQSGKNDPLTSSAKWGHLLWLACILWSPEAGIHATAIWGPYFVWTRISVGGRKYFPKSIASLAVALLSGLGVMVLVYRVIFGDWFLPKEYLTYVLHPPGPMPVNPNGTVWFAIAAMTCWFLALSFACRNSSDTKDERASWLVALLALANFTYYLGRSHDNNILNLMPCLSLLLIATRAISLPGVINTISTTLLVTVMGFTTLFGGIKFVVAQEQNQLFSFSPQALVDSFNREKPPAFSSDPSKSEHERITHTDISAILKHIHQTYHEPVEVFDEFLLISSGEIYPPWSALHGPANLALLPTEIRSAYIARIAKRFHRPGWLLYEKSFKLYVPQHMLELDSVYDKTDELDFGLYKAIRYAPK